MKGSNGNKLQYVMDLMSDINPEAVLLNGHDNAIIGVSTSFGKEPVFAYSLNIILKNLMRNGMTKEEAVEFYEYSIVGAYFNEHNPVFIETFNEEI